MGGEHRCYGCDRLVGMLHAASCHLAGTVTEGDVMRDATPPTAEGMTPDRALELAQAYTHRVLDGPTTLLARRGAREEAREAAAALAALREQLRKPQRAYVVMTGRPGPGVAALVEEAIERTADDGKNDLVRAVREAVAQGCEFVELETPEGVGLGPSSGIDWEAFPGKTLWRLGPFLLP